MGRIRSTKPSLTSADIQAALAAALTAHSFDTPLTVAEAQAAAAAALTAHVFESPLTEAQVQTAAEAALTASPPSNIASIQRGSVSVRRASGVLSARLSATISSVDTSKAWVNLTTGVLGDGNHGGADTNVRSIYADIGRDECELRGRRDYQRPQPHRVLRSHRTQLKGE